MCYVPVSMTKILFEQYVNKFFRYMKQTLPNLNMYHNLSKREDMVSTFSPAGRVGGFNCGPVRPRRPADKASPSPLTH